MIGMLLPEGVDSQIDKKIRLHQGRDGLVATIQHQSDGDQPTTVYAVTNNNVCERRLPPS